MESPHRDSATRGGMTMTPEEKAAVIQARCATATIRAMGMQAENMQKEFRGAPPAYTQVDFDNVIEEEGTHWNAVSSVLFQ